MSKSVSKRFIMYVTKYLFKNTDICRFYLTDRGFFSEINNLIFAIYYLDQYKKKIIIDSSYFVYEWDNNKQCIFDSKYTFVKGSNFLFKRLITKNFMKSYFWIEFRNNITSTLLQDQHVISKLRSIQNDVYRLLPLWERDSDLPEKYVGIHIRRGDKVYGDTKEADKAELKKYLSLIPDKYSKLPLFVVTDDETVLKELKNMHRQFFTYFDPIDIRINEREFRKADKTYVKQHTIHFLRDVDLLINGECFIGSYSSNVGRFIALKRDFKESYSVDCKWYEMY